MEVKLKKSSEIDFNKTNGHYHFSFDLAKKELGRKKHYVLQEYNFYGNHKIHLLVNGSGKDYPLSMFNIVTPTTTK